MKKLKLFLLSLAFLVVPTIVFAQGGTTGGSSSGNITTAGNDCSVSTRCVVMVVQNTFGAYSVTVTGTFSGTLQFEGTGNGDGSNSSYYTALGMTPLAGGSAVTSTTGVGAWTASASGLTGVRVRASAIASGTAVIAMNPSFVAFLGGGSEGGSGSSAWSGITGASTNTATSFVSAPTSTSTVLWTYNCPLSITVDCIDWEINSSKVEWIDSNGHTNIQTLNLPGSTTNDVLFGNSAGPVGQVTAPATQGLYTIGYNPTTSASVAPVAFQVGIGRGGGPITGSTSTYTVLYTDVATIVNHDVGGSAGVTVTLPTATTLGDATFGFRYCNQSAHADTITPTTWTIQVNGTAAAATAPVAVGTCILIWVDPNSATNWLASGGTAGGAGLSGMTATQVPIAATASTVTSSVPVVGTDAGLASAGTISNTAGYPVVSDSNGGVTTTGSFAITAAGTSWIGYSIYGLPGGTNESALMVTVANQPSLFFFNLPVPAKVSTVSFYMSVSAATSTGDVGMYNSSGTLLWHTGSFATTSNGLQSISLGAAVTMLPGQYFEAMCNSSATPSINSLMGQTAGNSTMSANPAHTWGTDTNVADVCVLGVLPSSITVAHIVNSAIAGPPMLNLSN